MIEPWAESKSGSHFAFTHGLLVDAVHRSINPRRIARIHERVAAAMEARCPDSLAEIAIHYERAGNRAKAYHFAMGAGRASPCGLYAHAEARRFFEIAGRAASDAGRTRAAHSTGSPRSPRRRADTR